MSKILRAWYWVRYRFATPTREELYHLHRLPLAQRPAAFAALRAKKATEIAEPDEPLEITLMDAPPDDARAIVHIATRALTRIARKSKLSAKLEARQALIQMAEIHDRLKKQRGKKSRR